MNYKKAIIVGATSGIGYEVANILWNDGWSIGIAGRREENLIELSNLLNSKKSYNKSSDYKKDEDTQQLVAYEVIDITKNEAPEKLKNLIDKLGGLDLYFHSSGIGWHNEELDIDKELITCNTNVTGFTRMIASVYKYFETIHNDTLNKEAKYQIAIISSIAGYNGLGPAASYSATKAFNFKYITALSQLAKRKKLPIYFTDIRPGFVKTAFINSSEHKYPMLIEVKKCAKKIVKAIYRKNRTCIIDWRYKVLVFLWRLIPNYLWEKIKL